MARIPMTASSTRRKRQRSTKRRNGWNAKWSDELKLKEGETAWVMLTPGDYPAEGGDRASWLGLPMYKVQYVNKWGNDSWGYFQGQKNGDCTLEARASCGDSRVTAPRYADEPNRFWMNVVHLDLFKCEDVLDKNGEPLRYKGGKLKGQVIKRWVSVKSIREKKDIIKSGDFDDCRFFMKKFMELPMSHFEALKGIARVARTMCECGGSLTPAVYTCTACEGVLLDVEDTDLSESEVAKFGDNEIRCTPCGHHGYPEAHSICDTCDDPVPRTPWAVAAQITKVREGNYPTLRVLKVQSLTDFQLPSGEYAASPDDDGGFVLDEDLQKLADAQYDLTEYAAAKPNSFYSDLLGLREGDLGFDSDSKSYSSFR